MTGQRRVPWLTLALVVPAALAVPVALARCPSGRPATTQIVVALSGGDAADHSAAVAVVEDILTAPELVSGGLRSSSCPRGGAVLLSTSAPATNAAANARAALDVARTTGRIPAGVVLDVSARSEVIAHFAVRGIDPFVARAAVDAVLLPALRSVGGADAFEVHGGRREQRVALDPERLLAAEVALPEVLSAVRSASALDKIVLKESPGVRLVDVATVGSVSAGEPLRRDGALEIVVRGTRRARRSMLDVLQRVTLPAGVVAVALDEASDEVVAVRIRGATPDDIDDLRRTLLAIPGVRTATSVAAPTFVVDKDAARARGVDPGSLGPLVRLADDGVVVDGPDGPVRIVVAQAATPEALLSLVVAQRTPEQGGPVRLFDVARVAAGLTERTDRLDRHPAVRLLLRFDVGARRSGLTEVAAGVAAWSKARPGAFAIVERAHDVALFDAVCP
jgi:multidrug efflux pump subunit AcrB